MKEMILSKKMHLFILACIGLLIIIALPLLNTGPLSYVYKESFHHDFYFEGDYVVFFEDITIENRSAESFYFYLSADVSKDMGLVAEETAIACEKDSLDKARFFIGGNTIQGYTVYFKVLQGDGDTKSDRMPPKIVHIDIIE